MTVRAVSLSIAYAGPGIAAAHLSASAIVFVGSISSRCGKIEKSTSPSAASSPPTGGCHPTNCWPMRGVSTMLPPLSPSHTVSDREGSRSASPDSRIQWHR